MTIKNEDLQYNLCALFPKQKILNYINVVTFETYLENESLENVLRLFGIDWRFLDKNTFKIHPCDILLHHSEWNKIEDVNIKDLFEGHQKLYKIDLSLSISNILIPLTRIFNTRFELFPYEWLTNYVSTLCDDIITDQKRISIFNILDINKITIPLERKTFCDNLIKKYIFSTDKIAGYEFKSITEIDNPFI